MELATIANIAEIIGATTVVGGALFALAQLRAMRQQRKETSAMAFMDSVQNAAFAKAYLRILRMPDGVSMAQMREQGDQYEDAAMFISTNLETIGIMVYREIVDFNMVNDLIGDAVVLVWHKLENWATEMRAEQRRE
ncbi:MAG: hypothetical protein MJA83_02975, partial [Gammaproteobacteria bacterium]|nr:hypothetical protein [Gammaproteobacteria bacterium]